MLLQPCLQRRMDGVELGVRHGALPDLGLIGADRDGDAGAVQTGDGLGGAGDQGQLPGTLDVVAAVDDDHAVAIEKA